ncbi:MAG: phosphoribosyltransferase family protein [Gemmatimonadales bacterium]
MPARKPAAKAPKSAAKSTAPKARRRLTGPTATLEVDWPFFGELCRALALKVARDFDPEVVLGIVRAGAIPGVVVASILQREFASMAVYRPGKGQAPELVSGPPATLKGRRVLIVDATCDSGDTMELAVREVEARLPKEIRTAVAIQTGGYRPDYEAFLSASFIVLPWDREVLAKGKLVVRPDYAERLGQD